MADTSIRLATAADAATLTSIERVPDEGVHATVNEGRALVAVDTDQRLIGVLTWSRTADVFEIEHLTVLPEADLGDVGTALVHRALTTAARLGCTEVRLSTHTDESWNGAWFRRFGFESIDQSEWMRLGIDFLNGGVANAGAVARIGNVVMRPANEHSDVLHGFLRHLRDRGFEGASEPIGVDDGVELLRFIDGDVPVPPYPAWAQTDLAITSTARLIRGLHDASAGFDAKGVAWSNEMNDREPGGEPVICHNDVCLENVVFRDGEAIGLLDFDFAAPGRPAFDLTSFARMCVPVDDDVNAPTLGWHAADRPRRVRLVADAYGLDAAGRAEMLTCLDESIARGGEFVLRHVEAGEQGFIDMWDRMGGMARFDRRRDWWATARPDFAASLA